jgi:hypothetical protein
MKNFYMTGKGKLCLSLLFTLLFTFSSRAQHMVTYDTTFSGWNAIVTEDISLQGTDSAAGIVFFPGIGQMDGNVNDLAVNGPHYLINNGLWDGSVRLSNGVHHPFIISLQPPASGYPASEVLPKIQAILARYRIKRNSFYFTGLSVGGWQANEFVAYEPTPGDNTCGNMVRAIVNLEGVEPADNTGIYLSESYPNKMGHWAAACGGRELWVEGSQDWRDMLAGAQNMMDSVAGSATYFMVTYGGGAHCCWNSEYDTATTWTMPTNSNISEITGQPQAMNVWQWLLRQGDTSMPGSQSVQATPPTVSAGIAQTVTLPVDSVTLSGTATASGGATISGSSWTQVSGPNTATIGGLANPLVKAAVTTTASAADTSLTVSTSVSGLVAGTYVFELMVQASNGLSSTSTVTIVVKAPVVTAPPAVSAGKGQAITLPTSSTTLNGTASGNDGATIKTLNWVQESGPVTATIVSPSSTTTTVTGMTTAGTYVFVLFATDDNGLSAYGSMTVWVNAESAGVAPTVSAGKGQAITLPTSSTTLNGSASGNDGATIKTVNWVQESGPVTATIVSPSSTTTSVTGMTTAGSYIFVLFATDDNGLSAYGSMTVWVNAESVGVAPTVSAGKGQAITLPTSSTTLNGSASGNDGATIKTLNWVQESGPVTATIVSPSSATTTVTGMTTAGSYIFVLFATDNNGLTAYGSMTVTVYATGTTTTTSAALSGQAMSMTDSTSAVDSTIVSQAGSLLTFPNPVHDLLNIRLNNAVTGKVTLMIFDTKGNRLQTLELEKGWWDLETAVEVSLLKPGVYVLEILTGTHLRTAQKFIKQ